LVLGSMLLAMGGCPGGGSDDGSAGDGAAHGGGNANCDDVCNALFAQSCFYGGGESDCSTSCNGWDMMYASGTDYCQQAWSDYKSCIAGGGLTCIDDGNPDWNAAPCRGDWDHVQNYCVNMNAMPDTPCMENAAFDAFCSGTPATPHGKSCFGDAPAGCVVGGTENNSNLYCCP
jgi:hypothetical protein